MVSEKPTDPIVLGIIVLACIAILMSGTSTLYIFFNSKKNAISPRLLLYLHLSLFVEEICCIPFLYTPSPGLCKFVGWLSYYASLANIMAMSLLVVHYVNYLSSYSPWLMKRIAIYKTRMVFGFPLITLLPLSTPNNSYGRTSDIFCSLPSETMVQNIWAVAVLYFWLWVALAVAIYRLVQTLYKALKLDFNIASKIFSTMGIFVFVTMLAWLERTIPRLMHIVDPHFKAPPGIFYTLIYLIYAMGIIYGILLIYDPKVVLVDYGEGDIDGDDGSSQVDWEDVRNTLHQISTMRGSTGDVESSNNAENNQSYSRMSEASGSSRQTSTSTGGRNSVSNKENVTMGRKSYISSTVDSTSDSNRSSSRMTGGVNPNDEL